MIIIEVVLKKETGETQSIRFEAKDHSEAMGRLDAEIAEFYYQ